MASTPRAASSSGTGRDRMLPRRTSGAMAWTPNTQMPLTQVRSSTARMYSSYLRCSIGVRSQGGR